MLITPFSILFIQVFIVMLMNVNSRIRELVTSIETTHVDAKKVMKIYSHLHDLMTFMNQLFSINFMLVLTEVSVHLMLIIFNFYHVILNGFQFAFFWGFAVGFSYLWSTATGFILLTFYARQVRKSGNDIWQTMNSKREVRLKTRLVASYQMAYSELVASCGVYEFDWKIIFSLMSGAFGYFIVAIQFDGVVK
jgi:hypothetical protein